MFASQAKYSFKSHESRQLILLFRKKFDARKKNIVTSRLQSFIIKFGTDIFYVFIRRSHFS